MQTLKTLNELDEFWYYFSVYMLTDDIFLLICVGNCAIISPSECTAHTAELLHRLIPFYLDNVSYYMAGMMVWVVFI